MENISPRADTRGARRTPMTDVFYLLLGAAFLVGCAFYAIACDRL